MWLLPMSANDWKHVQKFVILSQTQSDNNFPLVALDRSAEYESEQASRHRVASKETLTDRRSEDR